MSPRKSGKAKAPAVTAVVPQPLQGASATTSPPVSSFNWPSLTLAGLISILTLCGPVYFAWYTPLARNLDSTYIANIEATLKGEFKPPLEPAFGPLFSRPEWEKEFKKLYTAQMYVLYSGPSGLGKSVAVVQALRGRKGVIYLSLRGLDDSNIAKSLANALDYSGREVMQGSESLAQVLEFFEHACRRFYESMKSKVVMVVEDIHSVSGITNNHLPPMATLFTSRLVDLYNSGLLNVVYTASENNAVAMLSAVSGHKRLVAQLFPAIDEQNLVNQIATFLGSQFQKNTQSFHLLSPHHLPDTDSKEYSAHQAAHYIVSKLGGHMGEISHVLSKVIADRVPLPEAVEQVLTRKVKDFYNVFPAADVGKDPAIIVVAEELFNTLLSDSREVYWVHVHKQMKDMVSLTQFRQAMDYLVHNNLLSYSEPVMVCFHSQSLRWAYDMLRTQETWTAMVADARSQL